MIKRLWWQIPQLRTDEDREIERKVSWLELFFDLYFVVVIAHLSHGLAKHISWAGIGEFVFLFIPVWWVWIGAAYYIERFETEGIEHRLFVFLQMVPIAGFAIFAHDALGETSVQYGYSYAISRTIQIFLWIRAGYHDRRFRSTAKRFVFGFSLSALLFYLSAFVSPPSRYIFWIIGLLIDLATPLFTLKLQTMLPRLSSSKLPERYGLFMIIVLGESVVGVVNGVAEQESPSLTGALAGVLGLALAFGLWWVYFDFIARRPPKPAAQWAIPWSYLHMPLAIAIAAAGAASSSVVAAQNYELSSDAGWLMSGAVSVALMAIASLETCLKRSPDEPTHTYISPLLKLAGALLVLLCGFLTVYTGVIVLQLLLLLILGLQIVYSIWGRCCINRGCGESMS